MSTQNYPNLHRHHITLTLPIPCVVQQWICCNIRPLVADNTFKFELLFKRTSQPKITLTSTDIILHQPFQSPVLFKYRFATTSGIRQKIRLSNSNYYLKEHLNQKNTLTSTNIILHLLFHIGGGSSLPLPLYVTLIFTPHPILSSPLDTSAQLISLPIPSYQLYPSYFLFFTSVDCPLFHSPIYVTLIFNSTRPHIIIPTSQSRYVDSVQVDTSTSPLQPLNLFFFL